MRLEHILRLCTAITTKGRRCQMAAEPGESKCRYHLGDSRTEAQHAKNRAGTRRYWERRRSERAATAQIINK
jgi:hypothetical protein